MAQDSEGRYWAVGRSYGDGFPATRAVQSAFGGGGTDAVALLLSADGASILFATYLGGEGVDLAYRVAVDDLGSAYLCGWTTSAKFPVTAGALQSEHGGGFDAFIVKLGAGGSGVHYATYLGGARAESALSIVVDARRRAYVTGLTGSSTLGAGIIPKRIGSGGGQDRDAYVARLNEEGTRLEFLSAVGGSGNDSGTALALDASGRVVLFGQTTSTNFPTLNPIQASRAVPAAGEENPSDPRASATVDHFLSVLDSEGGQLRFSTYFGGTGSEDALDLEPYINEEIGLLFTESGDVVVAADGRVWIASSSTSMDLPGSGGTPPPASRSDAYVALLDPSAGRVDFLSYLGGSGDEGVRSLALDSTARLWAAGSSGFSIRAPYFPSSPGVY